MKTIKSVKKLDGKKVLLRLDVNEPINKGKLADDTRIRAVLPTIEYLLNKGARIILAAHLGRPNGFDKKYSLAPIAKHLGRLLGREVRLLNWRPPHPIPLPLGERKGEGYVVMLENIRFQPGEEKGDLKFAKSLASLADIFVNDAFSVCHRPHASVVGITKYLPSYAGLLLEQEIKNLSKILEKPKKPFVALLGGVKISDKIGVIKNLSKKADIILLGGALINNFYKAKGYEVGASLIEAEGVKLAKRILKSKKIFLPMDVVIGTRDGKEAKVIEISNSQYPISNKMSNVQCPMPKIICRKPYAVLDIGPKTILEYAKQIKKAKTLVWNGPMGLYEVRQFSHGTLALGSLFAARSKGRAFGVAGGGETLDALKQTKMGEYVDWISTGGGAMLEFLEGKTLPGIKPLITK